jgi:hypothetical protein
MNKSQSDDDDKDKDNNAREVQRLNNLRQIGSTYTERSIQRLTCQQKHHYMQEPNVKKSSITLKHRRTPHGEDVSIHTSSHPKASTDEQCVC